MKFTPPMTMMDFFLKSEGIWFSQRTVHHFDSVQDESGKSNLIVKVLTKDDPKVLEVCEQQNLNPALATGGASFNWQDNLDDDEPNPNYAAILVDIPDSQTGLTGKFLRNRGYVEGIPVVGRYHFATDGVLTIDTEYERNQGQERCWFLTDDFRVRVSTVRMMNGVNLMAYCSERRCITRKQLEEMIQKNSARISS
ncbi:MULTISPECIES: phycobiliprotein lyase [Okeania]|uniref:Chromophore lyase CpcS/CpeS n=1 Tax=Okeania hirsuta TaxID=1458930 RepID=A0A3N6RP28_9CYAN|nr:MULTISPECIES: phycobiliprotein lyase [Okeania]NET16772.1 phycobiliprotein lyase [Okeania sp. SIO1H6]NEP85406.1 phycobiliprotein lyase [Okeania sp. SIO2C2]NES78870.1 phycobiliprotein lyase [Okeania sp. SIO1H4]NES90905.1 phycobiliprotein lyase [Okeania sp. SIO2B9]NET22844.1 phycobiliprotein lyase [Okeania sp. SIO1H5]